MSNTNSQSRWVSFCCTTEQGNGSQADHSIHHFWRPLKATEGGFRRLFYPDRLPVAIFHKSYQKSFPAAKVARRYNRRQLQRLAKIHGVRANSKSAEIAAKLEKLGVCLKVAAAVTKLTSRSRKRKSNSITTPITKRGRHDNYSPINSPEARSTEVQTPGHGMHSQPTDYPQALADDTTECVDVGRLMFLKKQHWFLADWAPAAWDKFLLAQVFARRTKQGLLPRLSVWLGSRLLLGFALVEGPPAPGNEPTHVRVARNGEISPLHYGEDLNAMELLLPPVGEALKTVG